jgi:hypothetical protein
VRVSYFRFKECCSSLINDTVLYGDLSPSLSLNIKICSSPACLIKKVSRYIFVLLVFILQLEENFTT